MKQTRHAGRWLTARAGIVEAVGSVRHLLLSTRFSTAFGAGIGRRRVEL
ncbi:MAG TPA: hypothetical protein VJ625_15705 [Propionibacteriaceae bacterium]|nr:hypothetical protein [Propionibacteriaceae bacterium]